MSWLLSGTDESGNLVPLRVDSTGILQTDGATEEYVDDAILTNGSSGRELGYASSTAVQTGIAGTATDITSLSITFDVGARPVYVMAHLPYTFPVTSGGAFNTFITDAANTTKGIGGMSYDAASAVRQINVVERINTPGTYTRKVRVIRASGTGTLTVGFNANTPATIRAIEA